MKTVVRISGILITHDGLLLVKCDGVHDYILNPILRNHIVPELKRQQRL